MKLVGTDQMRDLDRRTIEESNVSGETLMDRAGQGVADVARRMSEIAGFTNPFVLLIAGRGNNGGDAFTAARHLKEMGFDVEVWLAGAANEVRGDALKHLSKMKTAKVPFYELPTKEDWDETLRNPVGADVLIDGVLGTGSSGPARGPAVGAIQYINARSRDSLVIAIDIPSGLDADTGKAEGEVVRADVTVTMGLPKRGLVEPAALEYVGSVEVVDIGIPPDYVEQVPPEDDRELVYLTDIKPLFPRRKRASHKGDYGHVLLIGGARGYAGAIAMAARAAVRSGVGLVHALVPESIAGVVAGASLEAMVVGARETESGSLSIELWKEWKERINKFDAVLLGPGLTRHGDSLALVKEILQGCEVPLALDADALSVLEGQAGLLAKAGCSIVITPHPGELSRLIAKDSAAIQADRCGAARAAAQATGAVVVLKGAGTIVAEKGRVLGINLTGNPGMAKGGSGDVLAGLLAGLLAQGLPPYDAARAAVYIHGHAGDMAAWRKSQAGINAGDLIEEIPYVFRDLALR